MTGRPKPPLRRAGPGLALALLAGLGSAAQTASRPDDLWPQAVRFPDAARIQTVWKGDGTTEVFGR
ncbi:MAG: hypothetical protein PHU21_14890, partial [Elusimicrobia bacterium]|nr:hypothetical protein [Elusimicrobiota bacterium]